MGFTGISGVLIAVLVALPMAAAGFEIEDFKTYPAQRASQTLRIISTADGAAFDPIIRAYQAENPGVSVEYTIASSTELMKAIYDEAAAFDLAISSAMDLQTKIANDGFALPYTSPATQALPGWAKWRDQVFAFTQEPAVLVVSDAFFAASEVPRNREDLIGLLRDDPVRFRGRVGTYDVRISGLGYLFATQDSRNSENYWRLTEVMRGLDARLYCCSGAMIRDVENGRLALAYNVLGSYAETRIAETTGIRIVELDDFLSVMLRTALIPNTAENIVPAQAMVDFLARLNSRPDLVALSGLPPIDEIRLRSNNALRPIRLGPGLLVFLDRLKRQTFLRSWASAIEQQ
jgi:iron(III) transport system substrate-binding protein